MSLNRSGAVAALAGILAMPVQAGTSLDAIAAKLDALIAENAELKARVAQLESTQTQTATAVQEAKESISAVSEASRSANVVRTDHDYSYAMLDPNTWVNRKEKLLLERRKSGSIPANTVILSGAVTPIVDIQKSNTEDKFGYLMRHPTASNQRTTQASEAVVHSAQLGVTGTMGDWITGYMEMLYNPTQSFGTGTLTDINRNQVEMRKGYVILGNLNESPYYAQIGKMDTPFGLMDTVNPFTSNTVWHAFGGLAYGLNLGYDSYDWDMNFMAIQGGAQFRAHNVPVDRSNVPSKLSNYAVDVNRTFSFDDESWLLVGGSYTKGSAYCQGFPVTHFSSCAEANGAFDVYGQYVDGDLTLEAEFAKTTKVWPGTFNPTIPQFEASKVTSFGVGGKYRTHWFDKPTDLSVEFSRFIAGPNGAPWEKQDQLVFGAATFITPSAKLFGEVIHTAGFAPLNNISGDGVTAGVTISDRNARSNIILFGANVAF
ncbi:MAG: hypothetical protein H6981_02255 [Gammaproteobacteria bacterium]|nr:hypothetical protein [Gammaproteobacteria bacterium]MCP5135612.1 hypothetical protein [Gammaproteobacteria bacterium]